MIIAYDDKLCSCLAHFSLFASHLSFIAVCTQANAHARGKWLGRSNRMQMFTVFFVYGWYRGPTLTWSTNI